MGKGTEWTMNIIMKNSISTNFLKNPHISKEDIRFVEIQNVYANMSNIINHQRNMKGNHNEVLPPC